MTEASNPPSMKLQRKKTGAAVKTTEARIAAISAGEARPKSSEPDELEIKPSMFRLSKRTRNLLALAKQDAERREGRRVTLTSRVEDAIIATYKHLEEND